MKKSKKVKLICISVIALALIGYIGYLAIHYYLFMDYKKYLTEYTYEKSTKFTELKDNVSKVPGMVLVSENDFLQLYTNTKTTEVAVYDKRSGEITYSNPVDRANDPIANGRNKVDLNSQFMLTYYDNSMTQVTMYNYDYSVERGQFEIEGIKNGIRYTYLLGNLESPTGLVPPFITEQRLNDKVLSKLTEREAKSIRNNYMDASSNNGVLELTKGSQTSKIGMQKLNKLFEKAGYTKEDFKQDAASSADGNIPEQTTFTIPLEYRLNRDKLIVSVPTDHIKETGSGKLANIDILSYFGAGASNEKGYLVVPNGSGSLINFNNGKKTERYNQYLYGMDEVYQTPTVVEDTEKTRLPVFGIKHENSAVFAEISDGDTLANIIAEVSGDLNSYNYAYPSFLLRGSEKVSMFGADGASADLPTLEKKLYDVNITISYSFLEKKDSSYSGMASYYRNELINRGALKVRKENGDIPFYLDIVGGVKMQESALGVPYMGVYPMTTFEQAETIVDEFRDNQVSDLRVNYLGWFNKGYYHDVPTHIRVDKELGGKKGFKSLEDMLSDNGAKLYADVAFQKVSYEAKHFDYRMESSMYYSGIAVGMGRVNPATVRQTGGMGYGETFTFMLSPKFLGRYVDGFLKDAKKLNVTGVSLRDLGDSLTSDKRRTNVIDRQQTKAVVTNQLKRMAEATDHVIISGGNAYSLPYATDLENVPASHNPFYIVDEEIPFYQMVIHGCIDYSAGAINLSDSYDKQNILLRMIEFGMSPRFTLSYEESSKIKFSGMNSYYSTQYQTWLTEAVDIYKKSNEVLKNVEGSTIINHMKFDDEVKRITYDNGIVIYVNYGVSDRNVEGVTVPAKGYIIKGGR